MNLASRCNQELTVSKCLNVYPHDREQLALLHAVIKVGTDLIFPTTFHRLGPN